MKTVLAFAAVVVLPWELSPISRSPGNDFGPTRKLGRGISNLIIAPTEFFTTVTKSTKRKVTPLELAMRLEGSGTDSGASGCWAY